MTLTLVFEFYYFNNIVIKKRDNSQALHVFFLFSHWLFLRVIVFVCPIEPRYFSDLIEIIFFFD